MDEKFVMCVAVVRAGGRVCIYVCDEGCDAPACVCTCVCNDRNDELPMFSPKYRFISVSVNFPALLGAKKLAKVMPNFSVKYFVSNIILLFYM